VNYVALGRTGLRVARLCLGTMQFGWTSDREAAFAVLDAYREAGGNFIDTADVYSRWASGNPGGVAEEIVGDWLAERRARREMVVATKVRGRMWDGPNGEGLSRAHIAVAVEDSLRRLRVEAIDIYQAHWFDAGTPIEETLRAFDDLVRAGKVRYIGASNYPAWRLMGALWASDTGGWARFDSLQPHYNLVHRDEFERDLMDLCAMHQLGVLPYSPLQGGFLTGKYRLGAEMPASARVGRIVERYMSERNMELIGLLDEIAHGRGATVAQVALAWLLANPVVTSPIVGANTAAQLAELLPAVDIVLTDGEKSLLDAHSTVAERH
jgi:aryl-alcohol dehydrogenase-like predicted oxidoreductase